MHSDINLTFSVLVTREEYCEAVAHKKRKARRHIAPVINVAGGTLIVLGIAGLFFGGYISLSPSAAICLILLGIFTVCYDGIFAPILDKAAAAREYREKQDLHFATTYEFKETSVYINNSGLYGEIPLSILTGSSETPTLFIMDIGRELSILIPKRLLTEQQQHELWNLLQGSTP